ncbi:DUF423 domain-containing protein [Hyphococcus flavus]|uniref:DUF423 domain-containing protein n=1 Tax=Hyphococcus flavus TaxID=1866326 RepID=A0AAE9Z9T4_9PROT|nr:DUF423 domain-containing protein [Hyphococcus flavus]WDI30038.1 DUF423 domain-containing protein [Hyphococcus flavus]
MPRLIAAAGIVGFLAVALGAFGAHGLEGRLSAEAEQWWETATFYGLIHAVAALAIGLSAITRLAFTGWAFIVGSLIFEGSLYAMALGGPTILGAITPVGGATFLAGWAMTVWYGVKR